MFILLFLAALTFDSHECARSRSVNLALETILEFDKDSDISLVDRVQNFLSKVKSTIEESRGYADTRRSSSFKFSDFFEESVNILRSYNDVDLKFLLRAVEAEFMSVNSCKDDSDNDFELRRYLNEQLLNVKNVTGDEIRRKLGDIKRKLQNEEYKRNSYLITFLNSLFSKSENKFKIVLNDLQLFRRRNTNTNSNLRSIVKNTVGFMITNYYCSLKKENRQEIKQLLSYFIKSQPKRSRKRKIKDRKQSLRNDKRERNETLLNEIKERYRQYKQDYLKVKNYYKIKDSRDAKKLGDTKDNIHTFKPDKHENYNQFNPDNNSNKNEYERDIHRKIKTNYLTTDYKTNFAFDNNLVISSQDYITIKTLKKRKFRTTTDTTPEVNSKLDFVETSVHTQRNLNNSKEANMKRKRDKKRFKPNKILVEMFTTASESEVYKKHFLKKLLSKDSDADTNSKSNDDLPMWNKHTTRPSNSRFKTFITLYPERIDIFNKERTPGVRKRFKIQHNNETTPENIAFITTNAEIDIDIDVDKSLFKPVSIFDSKDKQNKLRIKAVPKRKFRSRKNKKKSQSLRSLATKRGQTSETPNARPASRQESSMEYFGSLYSHRNKHETKAHFKTYRKSNDNDLLQINNTNLTHNVTNATDKVENIESSTATDFFSDEITSTYGTLAFWSGTEKPTPFTTLSPSITTKNSPNTTNKTQSNSFENTTDTNHLQSTQIVFRSHTSNDTIEKTPLISSHTTKHNITTVSSTIISTTKEKHLNSTTPAVKMNTYTNTSVNEYPTTTIDLRRYLDNLKLDDLEGEKKIKVEAKIKEDIEKLLATNIVPGLQTKDEIDELEEAFNL